MPTRCLGKPIWGREKSGEFCYFPILSFIGIRRFEKQKQCRAYACRPSPLFHSKTLTAIESDDAGRRHRRRMDLSEVRHWRVLSGLLIEIRLATACGKRRALRRFHPSQSRCHLERDDHGRRARKSPNPAPEATVEWTAQPTGPID